MSESGGASTQAGIFYQNSVAALALVDLLELAPLPPGERVVEVRIEAPGDVDDIVLRYADDHRLLETAKLSIVPGDDSWKKMWASLDREHRSSAFTSDDQLSIVIEDATSAARTLRELCRRASSAIDPAELSRRVSKDQAALLAKIEAVIGSADVTFELVRRTQVRILSSRDIESEYARRRLGGDLVLPATLLSVLRDIVAQGARTRTLHRAPGLRRQLALEHDIDIGEPREWGLASYRATVARLARIEVPGTQINGPAKTLFVWLRTRHYERSRLSDFEDDAPHDRPTEERQIIDLERFPTSRLNRCVVVAGPGYGKSALITALSGKLADSPTVPVVIPLPSLAASDLSVAEFLTTEINRDFDLRADWRRLAEQGLLVLFFDDLDQVPSTARVLLQTRIASFSARYPLVPWMLTVRDPSVLSGNAEAELVELLPLDDGDIVRFVERLQHVLPTVDKWAFINRLRMYPDLHQLARIPLFLTLLLATMREESDIPASRSGLIERYLKTLFAPHEHKVLRDATVDRLPIIRAIAERLAFERLEKESVSVSESEVRKVARAFVNTSGEVEGMLATLLSNGILRRQSGVLLQFPFPIVQEYLAACHLIENAIETLPSRIDDAIHRPWAQAIQFALELHPEPEPIIRAMLERPSDAFSTGLRLVGRCIANGAKVDPALSAKVGEQLVAFWVTAPSRARERVGQLIADGFSEPISPTLRAAVHHHWLLNDGAGKIIAHAEDDALTLSVLDGLLARPLDHFNVYHVLKPAFHRVADVAFDRIVKAAKAAPLSESEWKGIEGLLCHFAPGSIERARALAVATDSYFNDEVRLIAFAAAGAPLDDRAVPLLRQVLLAEESRAWRVPDIVVLHAQAEDLYFDLIATPGVAIDRRRDLAVRIAVVIPDREVRARFVERCRASDAISREVLDVMDLIAARDGDRATFKHLIERLPTLSGTVANQLISLFGHYPELGLAERAAALARQTVHTGEDAIQIAAGATIGMLYRYEMKDDFFSGVLHYTEPHVGTPVWAALVDELSDRNDLSDNARLRILTDAAQLGSIRALDRLEQMVLAISDPDDMRYDADDDLGLTLRNALSEVRRRRPLVPFDLAERFARARRANVRYEGVSAIAAHGNRAALELLIRLTGEDRDWFRRDVAANAIETLSARLGVSVRREQGKLVVVEPLKA